MSKEENNPCTVWDFIDKCKIVESGLNADDVSFAMEEYAAVKQSEYAQKVKDVIQERINYLVSLKPSLSELDFILTKLNNL